MPIIDTPAGTLEVTNAILSASEFRATQKISVSNSAPTKNFSVGDKFHVSTTDADAVNITGNLVAHTLKIGNLLVSPTFDLAAVSNVGNTTSNTLQFANATTSFVASSNVEIGGNITLTSNAQVKVGSNVLAEYTGPHGREPREMPLKKFPEIAFDESKFDSNPTTNTYTQAGYTVSASSQYKDSYGSYRAFNHKAHGSDLPGWATSTTTNLYSETTGQATSNATLFDGNRGEYIDLKLPHKIKVSHFTIRSRVAPPHSPSDQPSSGHLYGSNDGSNWVKLTSYSGLTYQGSNMGFETVTVNATEYYDHLRLTATARVAGVSGSSWVDIGELEYYGTEEPAPPGDLSLDTTLKSTFNSVRSNNYVMYFDGKYFVPGDGGTSNNLVDNKSVIHHNATYDSTGKYWTLDGSTESNVTTGSLGFEGDVPHTVSTWINASNLEANALTQQIFSIGSGYDKAFLKVDDTQIAANTWHNVTYAYQGEGGSKVTYVDGRKVEEAQVEDTFGDYPPLEMTGYSQGGYRVSASSEHDNGVRLSWKAFESGTGNETGLFMFNETGPKYGPTATTSAALFEGVRGEWIKLELPEKIYINYLFLRGSQGGTQSPEQIRILGSNDDVNWDVVKDTFTVSNPAGDSNDAINSSKAYKYIVLQVIKVNGSTAVQIKQILYYGHRENDLTRFPEPTRVLKYPHVTMTGPAQRGYVASASNHNNDVRQAYKAFNNDTSDSNQWRSSDYNNGTYNSTTGDYTGSANLGSDSGGTAFATADEGEWIKLELSHKIKLQSFSLKPRNSSGGGFTAGDWGQAEIIKTGKLWASIDGTSWINICTITGNSASSLSEVKTFTAGTNFTTPTIFYKYYALVIEETNAGGGSNPTTATGIGEFQLYGTQEDTETPLIVGGPFAGKVANFRVYDQYLGDERIQEIYDAQKDEFGHKKSSMTFYKGRIGVGTTEPEGALTVIDEPHALAKFPARAVSADDSYVEGDGQIKLSAADGSGYQAFDGLTSTSWTATPTRNTRVSEEVDFGAWLKIQTPESMSLKKAEIESRPDWRQVGGEIQGSLANDHFGRSVACSHDGTRVIAGGFVHSGDQGMVRVYDWNGTTWELIGNQMLTGIADNDQFAKHVAISGDGNIIAVAAPFEHHQVGNVADVGTVRVYYLVGGQWTILPDSGTLTADPASGMSDVFVGSAANMNLGLGMLQLSYDGKTIAMCEYGYDDDTTNDVGRVLVYQYSNGAWSYKGTGATQFVGDTANAHFGFGLSMSEDGNHLAIGTYAAGWFVEVYTWDGSAWGQKGSRINQPSTSTGANDNFGSVVSVSNDGNTLAIGAEDADLADGALADNSGLVFVYHWTGSAWGTPHKLTYNKTDNEAFGTGVVLSGDGKRLVVSAPDQPVGAPTGELFTFEYTGGSWIMRTPGVQGLDGDATDQGHLGWGWHLGGHGFALSRDGSTIVAGELGDDGGGINAGRVRVFNMPSNIKSIWGSNDDVNWTRIVRGPTREEATSNVAGLAFGYDDRLEFKNLDNPNYYKYHAIVADAFTQLKDVKLFGVRNQGSSTLHDGALTLTKNLDVPRIGPPPDADDTPRRDRLVVEYNTSTNPVEDGLVRDTSGRGLDGALVGGAYYDAVEKALEFDGTDDYIEGNINNSGDIDITVSFWGRRDGDGANGASSFFFLGNEVVGQGIGIDAYNDGNLYFYMYGGHTIVDSDGASVYFPIGNWVHVVASRKLGTPTDGVTFKFYVNGEDVTSNFTFANGGGNALTLPSNAPYQLGYRTNGTNKIFHMNGKISNFKLYDTALTAQEVKTLYDMGRTGSVANPQPLHIAAPLYSPGMICQVGIVHFPRNDVTISTGQTKTLTTFNFKPKFANSRLFFTLTIYCQTGNLYWNIWVYRNDSDRITSHSTGVYGITGQNYSSVGGGHQVRVGQGYDDPNTTESQKYSVKFVNDTQGNGFLLGLQGPHLLKIEEICQ